MGVGAHRYWGMFEMTADVLAVTNFVGIRALCEVELRDSGGTAYTGIVADTNAAVTVGANAQVILDGNAATYGRFGSTSSQHPCVMFDLGSAKAVHSIRMQCVPAAESSPSRTVNKFKWMFSDDNVTWHFAERVDMGVWTVNGEYKTATLSSAGGTQIGGLDESPQHRYWRFKNLIAGDADLGMGEIKFWYGATQRTISSITASATTSGAAANLKDGLANTFWYVNATTSSDVSLTFDMGTPTTFNKIELIAPSTGINFYECFNYAEIQYSDDNATWYDFQPMRVMLHDAFSQTRTYDFVPGNLQLGYTYVAGGPGAHRYWRMGSMLPTLSATAIQIANVTLKDAGGSAITIEGINAGTWTATTGLPTFAKDGLNNTAWLGGAYAAWLSFDLGEPKEVRSIEVMARDSGAYGNAPKIFDWEWSDDGRNWTTFERVYLGNFTSNNQVRTKSFEAGTAVGGAAMPGSPHRYWRLNKMRPQGGWGNAVGLSEVKVYSGASQLTLTATTADSAFSGTSAANLRDNNDATVWASNGNASDAVNRWVAFDLGSAASWNRLALTARTGSVPQQWPMRFTLQYSDDNSTFTDFRDFDMSWISDNNEIHDLELSAATGTVGTGPNHSGNVITGQHVGFGFMSFVN